jgi:hypothetical protein
MIIFKAPQVEVATDITIENEYSFIDIASQIPETPGGSARGVFDEKFDV